MDRESDAHLEVPLSTATSMPPSTSNVTGEYHVLVRFAQERGAQTKL
jgi:hypothetical protein